MVGLMNKQDGAMPENRGVAPEADFQGQPNVTPEEQGQYDNFMNNALTLVYDDKMFPQIIARIKAGPDPTEALAAITATTVMRLEDSAKQAGKPISPDVLYKGGVEILEDLAGTAEKAGAHTFTKDELESATYQALDLYREMGSKDGRLDKEAIQQDMGALMEADSMGKLGTFFPELNDKFGKGAQ